MFFKYCPFLFIVCFEIILSVCACKNLVGGSSVIIFTVCGARYLYAVQYLNSYVLLKKEYVNFKLASLNVRGIRSGITKPRNSETPEHRNSYFFRLFFLEHQNTLVLVRGDLDFNLISINSDDEGRSIVMEAEVQESLYLFVNIYAPNKTQDQCRFFDKLNNNIEDCVANKELKIILGGDFSVTPTLTVLVAAHLQKTIKNVQNLCFDFDLVDIWRIRDPARRRFTWGLKLS